MASTATRRFAKDRRMHWSTHILPGAPVPLDNELEAKIAYSAFLSSLDEEAADISFDEFLAEYRRRLLAAEDDFV
jgi:hypothetical protein